MKFEIIPVYKNLEKYATSVKYNADNAPILWEQYAIEPYWKTLCQYAPYDLSYRKPQPIINIPSLIQQLDLLNKIDLCKLKNDFEKIASVLQINDDDTIYIALYPLSDDNTTVKERQNGVVGDGLFGNMAIHINPLAEEYLEWVPYVFAHEYHHTVWGNYWFVMHGRELENQFIDSLLIDGEANSFALSYFPMHKPKWLFDMSEDIEKALWKDHYSELIFQQNVDYGKFMFGNESSGIPWCAGYAIGYRIVHAFLHKNPDITFRQLLEMRPIDIFKRSGYNPISE